MIASLGVELEESRGPEGVQHFKVVVEQLA